MKQDQELTPIQTQPKESQLAEELDALQARQVSGVRTVTLRYEECADCGCGAIDCVDIPLQRVVDADSSLQDGDEVDEILDTDTLLDDE